MDQKAQSQSFASLQFRTLPMNQNYKGGTGMDRSPGTEDVKWKSIMRKPGSGFDPVSAPRTQELIGPGTQARFQPLIIPQQGPTGLQRVNSGRPVSVVQGGTYAYGQSIGIPSVIHTKPGQFTLHVPSAPPRTAFSEPERSQEEMKKNPHSVLRNSWTGDNSTISSDVQRGENVPILEDFHDAHPSLKSNFPSFILDLPVSGYQPSSSGQLTTPRRLDSHLELPATRKPPVPIIERKVMCRWKQHEVEESEAFWYVKCMSDCTVCATCVVEFCTGGNFRCPLCSRMYSRQEEELISLYAQSLNVPFS